MNFFDIWVSLRTSKESMSLYMMVLFFTIPLIVVWSHFYWGTTHKNEWNKFSRQCLDRTKFPIALASHCLANKQDVFQEWLEAQGDWSKVELAFERRVSAKSKFKKGRKGMKARDIITAYGEENFGLCNRNGFSFFLLRYCSLILDLTEFERLLPFFLIAQFPWFPFWLQGRARNSSASSKRSSSLRKTRTLQETKMILVWYSICFLYT